MVRGDGIGRRGLDEVEVTRAFRVGMVLRLRERVVWFGEDVDGC